MSERRQQRNSPAFTTQSEDVANSQLLRDVVDYHEKRDKRICAEKLPTDLIKAGLR